MHIYNITFIVEKKLKKSWIEHIDIVLLREISNNVHQVDLLKVTFKRKILPIYKAQHLQFNFTAQMKA